MIRHMSLTLAVPGILSLLFPALLLTGCGGDSTSERVVGEEPAFYRDGNEIIVTGGPVGLERIPVAVPWDREAPACLESDGETVAVQLEERGEKGALLWLLADTGPGQARIYRPAGDAECSGAAYSWSEVPDGPARLLAADGRPLLEYVHPVFDSESIEETKKPFHHLYAPDGQQRITKGVGGRFSHHRGIYFGYNAIRFAGQEEPLDTWHAADGERAEHRELQQEWNGPVFGGHEVHIEWKDRDGVAFADEVRRVKLFDRGEEGYLVELDLRLSSRVGSLELDGDLHHAGLQFRAAQYVDEHSELSRYLRPAAWADLPEDEEYNDPESYRDLPWNALRFVVEGEPYTVGYLSHPLNPAGAEMSERLYGRFGEFIPAVIDDGEPLRLRYRFVVATGHTGDREKFDRYYRLFSLID